ncbi:18134_t:CDS:1, partial [Funneliformis geosporum]
MAQCNALDSTYRAFMKNKLHLLQSTLSSVFHSNYFYNLMNLHHLLLAAHSEALHFSLNDRNLLGESTRLCIRQLQQNKWLHISPLIIWLYLSHKSNDW